MTPESISDAIKFNEPEPPLVTPPFPEGWVAIVFDTAGSNLAEKLESVFDVTEPSRQKLRLEQILKYHSTRYVDTPDNEKQQFVHDVHSKISSYYEEH